MAERKARKKSEAAKSVKQETVEEFSGNPIQQWGEDIFRRFFSDLNKYCTPLRRSPYARTEGGGESVLCIPYDTPVTHEEGASDVKSYVLISFGRVAHEEDARTPREADQNDEQEQKIQEWLSEIDLSIERMRGDQSEIDRLKRETRAVIERLKAA